MGEYRNCGMIGMYGNGRNLCVVLREKRPFWLVGEFAMLDRKNDAG